MGFPHPLQFLRGGTKVSSGVTSSSSAVSRNLCANCMAWPRASPCITVFSKWKSSSLCNGPSLAIASLLNVFCHCECIGPHASTAHGRKVGVQPSPGSHFVEDPIRARHFLRSDAVSPTPKTVPRKVHPRNLSGS